jgi:hypothetical protein
LVTRQGEVVPDSVDCVTEAVAVLSAVAKDLVVLQTTDRVLDPRTDSAMFRVAGFLAGQQRPAGRLRCGTTRPVLM